MCGSIISSGLLKYSINKGNVNITETNEHLTSFPLNTKEPVYAIKFHSETGGMFIAFKIGEVENEVFF